MSFLNRIIGRVNILELHFRNAEEFETSAGTYRISKSGFEKKTSSPDKNAPDILVITGAGVISKSKDDITESLSKRLNPDRFISMEDKDGSITFVRKEQVENVPYQPIFIVPASKLDTGALFDLWNKEIFLMDVIKFNNRGNILSKSIVSKIKIPLLLALLIVLTTNYLLIGKTRKEYADNQIILNSLKQEIRPFSDHHDIDFSSEKIAPAYMADRIGASTPATIFLTRLSIQPLTKRIEQGKDIQLIKNHVEVSGSAANTNAITEFMNTIISFNIAKELKLSSIKLNTEKKSIDFEILLRL